MNPFRQRCFVVGGLFALIILIYIGRLFFLQVVDQSYKMSASNNVLRYVTQYSARGLMYDRNGVLLVHNQAAYDLMVTVKAGSMKQLALFVSEKLSTLETVTGTATSFVLKRYKEDGVVFEETKTDNRLVISP